MEAKASKKQQALINSFIPLIKQRLKCEAIKKQGDQLTVLYVNPKYIADIAKSLLFLDGQTKNISDDKVRCFLEAAIDTLLKFNNSLEAQETIKKTWKTILLRENLTT